MYYILNLQGDTELTVGRSCSGKHVIDFMDAEKRRDGDCVRYLSA